MFVKKIFVKTNVAYPETTDPVFVKQIEHKFPFYYTPFTKNKRLLRKIYRKCQFDKPYQEEVTHFYVYRNGEQLRPDENGRVTKLMQYLLCNDSLNIEYVLWNGTGAELAREEGIRFFLYPNEGRHVPHIHAEYQGETISIEIRTLMVKGEFKNRQKQKRSVNFVKKNRQWLLDEYNHKTNGIHVDDIYI